MHTNDMLWGLLLYQDGCITESSEQCYKSVNDMPGTRRTSRTSTGLNTERKMANLPMRQLESKKKNFVPYSNFVPYPSLLVVV